MVQEKLLCFANIDLTDIYCLLIGQVYSFGKSDKGQLGHPDPKNAPPGPNRISAFKDMRIVKISAGSSHASAINGTFLFDFCFVFVHLF